MPDSERIPRLAYRDIDTDENFQYALEKLKSPETGNFVVEFGDRDAQAAFDIQESQWEELLKVVSHYSNQPCPYHTTIRICY